MMAAGVSVYCFTLPSLHKIDTYHTYIQGHWEKLTFAKTSGVVSCLVTRDRKKIGQIADQRVPSNSLRKKLPGTLFHHSFLVSKEPNVSNVGVF